jgi:uracil-DNA glycosylase
MGLALSVPDGVKIPPSLINVFTELSTDITGFVAPQSGNLTKWATEGVLLLNTALTIRYKQKESHMKLWQDFTDTLVKLISQKSDTPIVFMLWGNYAKGCKKNISNINKHLILGATHPSPLGSNQGGWFGCKHFSKCNDFLIKNKMEPIDWKLT